MLLLAPSTEKELTIGGLDIHKLNSWFNTAQKIENESIDSKGNKIVNSENYFSYLSKVFEEYKIVILSAINSSDFDENMSGIEDEKMGDEWNAMMIAEEKNEGNIYLYNRLSLLDLLYHRRKNYPFLFSHLHFFLQLSS